MLAGVEGNNLHDFIELYNPTLEIIDLKGYSLWYQLKEEDEPALVHVWDESYLVPPFGHFLLGQEGQDFGIRPDLVINQPLQPARGGLILKDPAREVVDSLGWGNAPQSAIEGSPAEKMTNGISLSRRLFGGLTQTTMPPISFLMNRPDPENTGSPTIPVIDLSGEIRPDSRGARFGNPRRGIRAIQSRLQQRHRSTAGRFLSYPSPSRMNSRSPPATKRGIPHRSDPHLGTDRNWKAGKKSIRHHRQSPADLLQPGDPQLLRPGRKLADLPNFGPPLPTNIEGGSIPIEIARTLIGQEVVMEGIATMYVGGFFAGSGAKFYISDDTGGAQVYVAGAGNTLGSRLATGCASRVLPPLPRGA